ncbi:MarR family winged helix-turn-helix transcriptional regulator [Paenibacillus piri]|uniref:HTH marR-type domain-containing protein n=1 Tax=Paenibacillus piri TaxID=2547395 RepID=A0A4R5KD52_9BACL|nr:DUF1691 domain-containing protein [Paenibacillus piri]TDF92812.1 hypothetical protein E1757_29330 [Paenibacillus piri]
MKLYDEPNYKLHSLTYMLDAIAEKIVQQLAGISFAQYLVLVAVGEVHIVTVTGIARWLNVQPPTSSHLCRKLESTGHLVIKVSDESLREKRITITQKGEEVLSLVNPKLEAMFASKFEKIPLAEREQFMKTLDTLLAELKKENETC